MTLSLTCHSLPLRELAKVEPSRLGPLERLGFPAPHERILAAWQAQEARFARYGETAHFAAGLGEVDCGWLSVFLNRRQPTSPPVATFGFPHLGNAGPERAEVLRVLLDGVSEWCQARGVDRLRGPIPYSTWYPCRFVLDERAPGRFPGDSPWPADYAGLFLEAGFELTQKYFSVITEPLARFTDRIRPALAHVRSKGFTFEVLRGEAVRPLFPDIHGLCLEAFAPNFGFTPIEFDEFDALFAPALGLAANRLIVGRDPAGRVSGFAFGYESPGADCGAPAGERVGVLKTIAVSPALSGVLLGPALSGTLHQSFLEDGFGRVIHALMAQQQYALGARFTMVELIREYGIFEKGLQHGD